jgi:adenosylmethionine---8-amino-7-oxononanoate aminotransferase
MTARRPSTHELVEWDRRHVWHPFTQMQEWFAEEPLFIERGDGNYLIDTEGRRYFDGVSSLWCNVHGHRKRELDEALREQIDRVAHTTMLGLGNVPATVLAKRLVEITPASLTRVFYSDAGATATEIAFKLALQYWQLRGETRRTRFVALTEGYHGDTLGAVSVGYSEAFHRFFRPVLSPALQVDPPHLHRWLRGESAERAEELAVAEAERVFAAHGAEIAALVVEPLMQGAAGMWPHGPGYLRALRELTRRHGTLLICDEVATGFGRTGRMFAVEHAAVEPDILCLGKGLTGGYMPLAATLASEEIFAAFMAPYEQFHAFFHGHTYTGNPLACAVALANLDVFEKERVVERVRLRAERLAGALAERCTPLEHVGDIRQCGLMVGIELVADARGRLPFPPEARIGHRTILEARRRGLILRPLGNVIVLMPPLGIAELETDWLAAMTAESIESTTRLASA